MHVEGGALYLRENRAFGVWPTNDDLVLTYVAAPVAEFPAFRADIEGHVLQTLDLAGDVGRQVRAGRRAERWYGTADLASRIRTPYGPGWALAGDAGLVMDPVSGQGIGHALRDAELLADAIVAGLGGSGSLGDALDEYARTRDQQTIPMYDFSLDVASFQPPRPGTELIFGAIAEHPAEVSRFLAALGGAISMTEFFAGRNLLRILGPLGMVRLAMAQRRRAA